MINKVFVAIVSTLVSANVMAHTATFEAQLGRSMTKTEVQGMIEVLSSIEAKEQSANLVLASAQTDSRTITYNMGCLTAKGGVVAKNVQKLVCSNIYGEVFTIAKSTGISEMSTFSLSANAGILYVRMSVNDNANTRLQSLQVLEEPVDAIGIDGAYGMAGAQILFLSSPNISVKLIGWTPGLGGGLVVEQNGNVDRSNFQGSLLTVKKFNF